MASILNAILCWLQDFFPSLTSMVVAMWDNLLTVADGMLLSLPTITIPVLATTYTSILGATGVAPAIAIIATAYVVRFTLQSIPFVRWGS